MFVKHGITAEELGYLVQSWDCFTYWKPSGARKLPYDINQLEEDIEYVAKKIKISVTELKN